METLTRRYVYDNEDIIAILDADGTPLHTFTHGPGIDEPLIMTRADGANYFYHADALGSITVLTDGNKEIVETYTYKAYGQPTIKDSLGAVFDKSAFGNPYFFTARELDSESGLYYYRARYYDWNRGAFTQEDPIGIIDNSANLYPYVINNPLAFIDPTGLWGVGVIGSVSTEAGLVLAGAGGTAAIAGGIFSGGEQGITAGKFTTLGGFAGGPEYGPCHPGSKGGYIAGAFTGIGAGAFLTNATNANQLRGISDTYSFNIGVGPIKASAQLGISNGIWIGSITIGPGIGISLSNYQTYTQTQK